MSRIAVVVRGRWAGGVLGLLPVAVTVEAPKFGVILVEIGAAVGAEKAGLYVRHL